MARRKRRSFSFVCLAGLVALAAVAINALTSSGSDRVASVWSLFVVLSLALLSAWSFVRSRLTSQRLLERQAEGLVRRGGAGDPSWPLAELEKLLRETIHVLTSLVEHTAATDAARRTCEDVVSKLTREQSVTEKRRADAVARGASTEPDPRDEAQHTKRGVALQRMRLQLSIAATEAISSPAFEPDADFIASALEEASATGRAALEGERAALPEASDP